MATSCEELTHWKGPWCWEGLGAGGKGDDRGWDGWMASPTQWTWVWVNCGSWWWTGRPGVLGFMGSKRVGHNWATELNWTGRCWLHHYRSDLVLWVYSHSRTVLGEHIPRRTELFLSNAPASAFFLLEQQPRCWPGWRRKCSVPPTTCAWKIRPHHHPTESPSKACTRNVCLSADVSSIFRNNELVKKAGFL